MSGGGERLDLEAEGLVGEFLRDFSVHFRRNDETQKKLVHDLGGVKGA